MTRLSILIASIPERFDKAKALYNHIFSMIGDKDIEVIMATDNKKRTIGEKREALKNISRGKYFMFVDDDDSLYELDEIYEATAKDVDVITFDSRARNNSGSSFIVNMRLGNPTEHNNDGNGNYTDLKRPPFPCCAWHEKFRWIPYPAMNYGEDWEWVKQALPLAHIEYHIDKVLHGYNFDPEVSAAGVPDEEGKKFLLSTDGVNFKTIVSSDKLLSFNSDGSDAIRCIVNVATIPYWNGQKRQAIALECHNEHVIHWKSEPPGSPLHFENPYAFKIYAIEDARAQGFEQILWLDASVYPVKDITPVWDWLTEKGIFMEEAGHYVGQWCNQQTLDYFKITRAEAMKMPMFSAGFVGFDFRRQVSVEFFEKWKAAMLAGMFKGDWTEHRHDMSVGSIIANQMGLVSKYSKGGNFFAYIGDGYGQPGPNVCFHLRGL
jgi:hypothetical protein